MAAAPEIDAVMVACSVINPERIESDEPNLRELRGRLDKPVIFCGYTNPDPKIYAILSRCGFPCVTHMPNGARAMAALADYQAFLNRFDVDARTTREVGIDTVLVEALSGRKAFTEYQAKAVLNDYGVIANNSVLVATAEEAAQHGASHPGPFAMKVQSVDISHKTEAGAVALNVSGEVDLSSAFERIVDSARAYSPQAAIDGVLLEPMAGRGVEMILGVVRDADFGPMLMAGTGGVLVEVLEDVVLSPVPVSSIEANRMLDSLTGAKLLQGVRGAPPADRDALVELMVKLSEFAAAAGDSLAELDLNPVIVHPRGEGVTVADALIIPTGAKA